MAALKKGNEGCGTKTLSSSSPVAAEDLICHADVAAVLLAFN